MRAYLERKDLSISFFQLPPQLGDEINVGADALGLCCRQTGTVLPPWGHVENGLLLPTHQDILRWIMAVARVGHGGDEHAKTRWGERVGGGGAARAIIKECEPAGRRGASAGGLTPGRGKGVGGISRETLLSPLGPLPHCM